jgi:hypothetical protein
MKPLACHSAMEETHNLYFDFTLISSSQLCRKKTNRKPQAIEMLITV